VVGSGSDVVVVVDAASDVLVVAGAPVVVVVGAAVVLVVADPPQPTPHAVAASRHARRASLAVA
jgi:hypothetical protein